jgi:shikimate dehydrogenase
MYNPAIAALGLDAVYAPVAVTPQALPHVLRGFEAAAVSGNITVPHKVAATSLLIRLTPLAKELQAVNTFWPEDDGGRLVGDNTDVAGVLDALEALEAEGPWLVAGTGGSARAVVAAARTMAATVLVTSRSPSRAKTFVAWARTLGADAHIDDGQPVGTAINATPLGIKRNDSFPILLDRLDGCRAALDLVYASGETAWCRTCRAQGLRAADGRRMLVAQGAHAFERFFPEQKAPREIMAAAVERELRR